jgi:hypothetical protein
MLRPGILLFSFLSLGSLCGGQALFGVQFEGSLLAPRYERGYVLDWNSPANDTLTLYGPEAKPLYSVANRGGDGAYVAWSVDTDGTTARVSFHAPSQGRIDVLDASGRVLRTINSGSYQAAHVTFGPDHTIWTVGFVDGCDFRTDDFNVVRHYSRTGEELGEALPWSQIADDDNACNTVKPVLGGIFMLSASDRFGFLTFGRPRWIEVGFDGHLLGQYDLSWRPGASVFLPLAMTSSGNVYARIDKDREFKGYAMLDRSTGTWRKITGYPEGSLIGADGEKLVFSERGDGQTTLQEVTSTALGVQGLQAEISDRAQRN